MSKFFLGLISFFAGMFGLWVISSSGEKLEKEIPISLALPFACVVLIIVGMFLFNQLWKNLDKINE